MSHIKCPRCGNEVSDSSDICAFCGHNLKEDDANTDVCEAIAERGSTRRYFASAVILSF